MSSLATKPSPHRGLFGRTRSSLLAALYGHPGETFHLRQLVRAVGSGHGAVQRELAQLTEMGLITRSTQGNQVLYRANAQSPVFAEIKSLIAKTQAFTIRCGKLWRPSVPRSRLHSCTARWRGARDPPNSDVDLMILADATFSDIVAALSPAQKALGREINPTVFSTSELRTKVAAGDHFLKQVLSGKKIFVIGTKDELAGWLQNSWLVRHTTSAEEIANLLRVSDRDLVACKARQVAGGLETCHRLQRWTASGHGGARGSGISGIARQSSLSRHPIVGIHDCGCQETDRHV